MDGYIARDDHGRVVEGSILNPQGRNGHLKGWARYGTRLQRYLEMPFGELTALITNLEAMEMLSSVDRAAANQAHNIGVGHIPERELGLNRIEGRTRQCDELGGPDSEGLEADAEIARKKLLGGAFTLTFGTEGNGGD